MEPSRVGECKTEPTSYYGCLTTPGPPNSLHRLLSGFLDARVPSRAPRRALACLAGKLSEARLQRLLRVMLGAAGRARQCPGGMP